MPNKLLSLLLLLSACATEAATDDADDPAAPIADVTDGAYRYRFYEAGGAIATLIDVPLGAPVPDTSRDACPLDTFARVAPLDATVPPALAAACPHALAQPGRLAARAEGMHYTPSGPICSTEAANDARAEELRSLAAYQPLVPYGHVECHDGRAIWSDSTCTIYYDNGTNSGCSVDYYLALVAVYGEAGNECFGEHIVVDGVHPNPVCAHSEWAHGDWHYTAWNRPATGTKMRGELSNCGTSTAAGVWKAYNPSVGAWSSDQPFTVAPNTLRVLTLSAGWDGSGDWRRWSFQMSTSGGLVNIASAGNDLGGLDTDVCPEQL